MGLKLEGGQLQKSDGLLQLRGHGQLLTQLELQGGFQHGGTGKRLAFLSKSLTDLAFPLTSRASETERLTQVHLTHLGVGKDFFRSSGGDYRAPG